MITKLYKAIHVVNYSVDQPSNRTDITELEVLNLIGFLTEAWFQSF